MKSPNLRTLIQNISSSTLAIVLFSTSAIFSSSSVFANSCSKSDIDYYLERGFSNEQVVQLCTAAAPQNTTQQIQNQQIQQANQLQEDQNYLSEALEAKSVNLTNQSLTIFPIECVVPEGGTNATVCIDTKIMIDLSGMIIGKASKRFLLRGPKVNIKGNIKRELVGLNRLTYKGDRVVAQKKLTPSASQIDINIREGFAPILVAKRLAKYSK